MTDPTQYESQKQRWFKYGVNVVIACIVVIALAGALVFLASRKPVRWDTTSNRIYSLKEQTVNVLKDIKTPIKLVSFYAVDPKKPESAQQFEAVADLLSEYKQKGNKVEVEMIDPDKELTKVDQFVSQVAEKYGSELKKFSEVVKQNTDAFEEAKKILMAESAKVADLPKDSLIGRDAIFGQKLDIIATIGDTLTRMHSKTITKGLKDIARLQGEKLPDYRQIKTINESIASSLEDNASSIIQTFADTKGDAKVDPAIAKYIEESKPVYERLKKLGEESTKRLKDAGELKLDEVREKLREKNSILVLGEDNMRTLSYSDVWQNSMEDARRMASGGEKLKPRFAGEQQVTSAILALTQKTKPKVLFARVGGPPLAGGMSMFSQGGPLALAAAQLEAANFQVLEKDLTGMWAMQAQMQQRPTEPEPTDDEIKDAIWIVVSTKAQNSPMGMPPSILPKVQEHLSRGGSALFLFDYGGDNLSDALKEFGIEVNTEAIICHEQVKSTGAATDDMIEQAQRVPYIFVTRDYGDHPITKPLRSLDSALVPRLIVKTKPATDVTNTALLPVPENPKAWGETDPRSEEIKFDEGKDIPGPLFSGATAEKKNGQRVVVIGSLSFLFGEILNIPDQQLRSRGIIARRFPGNIELFTNSIFWLAKMEPMLAISPAAMDVSRISDMPDSTLKFWRVGVLLVGLPGCVILLGVMVYLKRRD